MSIFLLVPESIYNPHITLTSISISYGAKVTTFIVSSLWHPGTESWYSVVYLPQPKGIYVLLSPALRTSSYKTDKMNELASEIKPKEIKTSKRGKDHVNIRARECEGINLKRLII